MTGYPGEADVDAARRAARQLQRDLADADRGVARAAAVRLVRLPVLQPRSLDELLATPALVTRAMAQDVIALEHGRARWVDLLAHAAPEVWTVPMYVGRMSLSLNGWFAGYDEAARARRKSGGFLLPYRRQFFVCDTAAIAELGLDARDPDWQRIDCDWVEPRDADAKLRLAVRRYQVVLERG